jgi:hypothetical protein
MARFNDTDIYFAAKEEKEAAAILLKKATSWFDRLTANKYLEKIKKTWCAYHGAYFNESGHEIVFSGEQGELVNLSVNHLRNLGLHIHVMITSTRPAMEARSTNTDYKSLSQTILANELLEYYMREKRLESILNRAVEYSIVMGAGYIKMDWNSTSGEVYDYNEETDTEIREGDIEFNNLSPFDVVYDSTKESPSLHDWVLCRTFKNKYDLAAKYPEFEREIVELPTKSDLAKYRFDIAPYEDTEDVTVYEFFHKRTEAMPEGRYLLFLSEDIVLMDAPMPYRSLPIFRISPSDILGTPYGYTPLFDLLPLQQAANSLYSTILSNQNAFGVQNIALPRGCDVVPSQIVGGLNIFEYNPQFGKPEAVNLTHTPQEIFKFLEVIERTMETISGVNGTARGNPQASLESGSALALVQSMALQFISGLQGSYIRLIEDMGTGIINLLKDFATVPRVAAIVGKTNRTRMKEFTGDDLSTVNRVIVDVGNQLARTTAGRLQIAENLMKMKADEFTIDQYFQVMSTGKLDVMTEGLNNEMLLIRAENEQLVEGERMVMGIATDDHVKHIREHKSVLADPDLRHDTELVTRVLNHIQEHITLLKTTDPDLLGILGEKSLQPAPAQQPPAPMPMEAPQAQGVPMPEMQPADLPPVPTPPAPFQNLPTNAKDMMPQ